MRRDRGLIPLPFDFAPPVVALESGYTHIDAALIYQNEAEVSPDLLESVWGRKSCSSHVLTSPPVRVSSSFEQVGNGIKRWQQKSGKSRDDIWVTSKLWNNAHQPSEVPGALETSLKDLQLE